MATRNFSPIRRDDGLTDKERQLAQALAELQPTGRYRTLTEAYQKIMGTVSPTHHADARSAFCLLNGGDDPNSPARDGRVKAYMLKLRREVEEASAIDRHASAARIREELENIALFDPANLYHEDGSLKSIHEVDRASRSALEGIEVEERRDIHGETITRVVTKKIKHGGKQAAIDKLNRMDGAYAPEKTQDVPYDFSGLTDEEFIAYRDLCAKIAKS